jgi:hypothetical protein
MERRVWVFARATWSDIESTLKDSRAASIDSCEPKLGRSSAVTLGLVIRSREAVPYRACC